MNIALRAMRDDEVRAMSFGAVKLCDAARAMTWEARIDGLFCERTFGPERDWTCACGIYSGQRHEETICHICGVKVGVSIDMRRHRFGHVNLREPVRHPLDDAAVLRCIPIMPITYREGDRESLNHLYALVVRANTPTSGDALPVEPPDHFTLADAVEALFCNERRTDPVVSRGRPIRSLLGWLNEAIPEDRGVILAALAVAIEA